MRQVTTHILDTSSGKPASGVRVIFSKWQQESWKLISEKKTNIDGRISDLLSENEVLDSGNYQLRFETKSYFSEKGNDTFYPYIEIVFEIKDQEHYHVPLLLNPFGYSTYRGS